MADVFISYHDKTNGDRAEKIAATLESAGITCWYARRDVPVGGDFTHEVIKQIGDCAVFLLLLDEGAAHSPHVETEVGNAFGRRKKIMPYQTDKKDIKSVSWVQYYLKQVQIVPLPDYNTLTEKIATALGRPIETLTPKPQPQKPTEAFVIAFIFISVIVGGIVGFFLGGEASFDKFLTIPLDDLFNRAFGIFVGYYVGWASSCSILLIIAEMTHNVRIPHILYYEGPIGYIMIIWSVLGVILGVRIGYMTEKIEWAVSGGVIAFLLCVGLVSVVMAPVILAVAPEKEY